MSTPATVGLTQPRIAPTTRTTLRSPAPLYYGHVDLSPATDRFEPQFSGLLHRKDGSKRDLAFLTRSILSLLLAGGGLTATTGMTYIREGRAPTPHEFLVDNFLRTSDGVRFEYLEPSAPYNNTDNLPPSKYYYDEVEPDESFKAAERIITNRIQEMLSGRPDLLNALETMPRGLTIKIYDVPSIYNMPWVGDERPEHLKRNCPDGVDAEALSEAQIIKQCPLKPPSRASGHASSDEFTQSVTLGLTLNYLERMFNNPDDGYEIIAHEVAGHIVDALDPTNGRVYVVGTDGMLPDLSFSQESKYRACRSEMKRNIENKESILRDYALKNDKEFLAVAVEAFFERPKDLQAECPGMHEVLSEFFNVDPDNLPSNDKPSPFTRYKENFPSWGLSAIAIGGSFLLVFGGHAIWVRLPSKKKSKAA